MQNDLLFLAVAHVIIAIMQSVIVVYQYKGLQAIRRLQRHLEEQHDVN